MADAFGLKLLFNPAPSSTTSRLPKCPRAFSTWRMCDRCSGFMSLRTAPSLTPIRAASPTLESPCSRIAV